MNNVNPFSTEITEKITELLVMGSKAEHYVGYEHANLTSAEKEWLLGLLQNPIAIDPSKAQTQDEVFSNEPKLDRLTRHSIFEKLGGY